MPSARYNIPRLDAPAMVGLGFTPKDGHCPDSESCDLCLARQQPCCIDGLKVLPDALQRKACAGCALAGRGCSAAKRTYEKGDALVRAGGTSKRPAEAATPNPPSTKKSTPKRATPKQAPKTPATEPSAPSAPPTSKRIDAPAPSAPKSILKNAAKRRSLPVASEPASEPAPAPRKRRRTDTHVPSDSNNLPPRPDEAAFRRLNVAVTKSSIRLQALYSQLRDLYATIQAEEKTYTARGSELKAAIATADLPPDLQEAAQTAVKEWAAYRPDLYSFDGA